MIEVDKLVFEYPTVRALDNVSLTVAQGEIVALVGPNGAGKTTLMRCMAALERPFSGTVTIDGLDTQDHPREVHARIGYLPDFFGLYDDLSVHQCLYFAARSRGIGTGDSERAVKKAAERVWLADRMDTKAGELSRGLRQRLAIGQAIVHEPRLLLLDEPASGLDPNARRGLSDLFRGLRDDGITLLVSSHILAELKDYSTSMIIMDQGRLVDSLSVATGNLLRIELAEPNDRLGEFLAEQDGITVIEASAEGALIELEGQQNMKKAKAALLRLLMDNGFDVSGISDDPADLQDTYFERVSARDGDR